MDCYGLDHTLDELRQREARLKARRQAREDMAAILAMPEGRRFFSRLLRQLGMGKEIGAGDLPLRNLGVSLLAAAFAASPNAAGDIIAAIHGGEQK